VIQLLFDEVRMTAAGEHPVLLLREAAGSRRLAIWVTAAAAAAVLAACEDADPAHPSLPDVFVEALASRNAVIESLQLTGVDEGVYAAQLWINGTAVDCRVSDGLALALRSGAPILAVEALLTEHAVAAPASGSSGAQLAGEEQEAVREFREFLNHVRPEDFDDPAGPDGGAGKP